MEQATKKRFLGAAVLLVGAALLLPVLLDGSGAGLTVDPLPEPPKVASVEAVSPKLDAAIQQAEQSINAAHEQLGDTEEDVTPDAAANLVDGGAPAVVMNAPQQAVSVPAVNQAVGMSSANAAKLAADKAAAEKLAAAKAEQDRLKQEKLAQEKVIQEKAAQEKAAQEARLRAEQQAAAKVEKKPDLKTAAADLPTAWVVQIARLSSQENANSLEKKLRQKGYRVIVQQQGSSWRVAVGPELRKEVAEAVKSRIVADAELGASSAFLQPYKP